ncbi:MAG: heme A synthase [Chloroflexi bacterium]|nr:heme A synthase [Chloroflexota bacterium]
MGTETKFSRFSWIVLAYNVLVVLFGAFVRATGSGAGCGAHWPLCNGVVIPRPERIETVIELTHRLTSGMVIILAAVLVVWAWRKYPKGSLLRFSSGAVGFFTITESLVGASLVLFGWVADDDSVARAISMMVHLVNTFLLLGAITLTAWWSTTGEPKGLAWKGVNGPLLAAGAAAILLLGASGAVTALGDTLFPASSLAEGIREEFSQTAHYLVRMRVYHPAIAVIVGIYLFLATVWVRRNVAEPHLERITTLLFGLYGAQLAAGLINVVLLAPVWMQIVHLLISTLIWITFILLFSIVIGGVETAPRLGHHEVHQGVGQVAE